MAVNMLGFLADSYANIFCTHTLYENTLCNSYCVHWKKSMQTGNCRTRTASSCNAMRHRDILGRLVSSNFPLSVFVSLQHPPCVDHVQIRSRACNHSRHRQKIKSPQQASKQAVDRSIDRSIHLHHKHVWCGVPLGEGAAAASRQCARRRRRRKHG